MSFNVALPANTSMISLSAGYIRNNNLGLQTALSSSTLAGEYPYIPTSGPTAIYFYASAAPSSWTLVNTVADCLLGIQGGTSQYMSAGGTVVGTWTTGGYAITSTDLPTSFTSGPSPLILASAGTNGALGNPHVHTWSNTRPISAVGILCTKNA